jgi:hypothetical protein
MTMLHQQTDRNTFLRLLAAQLYEAAEAIRWGDPWEAIHRLEASAKALPKPTQADIEAVRRMTP